MNNNYYNFQIIIAPYLPYIILYLTMVYNHRYIKSNYPETTYDWQYKGGSNFKNKVLSLLQSHENSKILKNDPY